MSASLKMRDQPVVANCPPLSANIFERSFAYAAIGKALVGLDGHFLMVNRSLCRIVGYAEQELLRVDFQSITHPDDLATDLALLTDLLQGKSSSYQMEKRYFHKQGNIIWVALNVTLVLTEAGTPDFFISEIQDISDRKRAQAERDTFFDMSPDMLAISSNPGHLEQVNPAWTHTLGWPAQELTGRPFLAFVHPDDYGETIIETEKTQLGKPTPGFTNRYATSNGQYRWIEWSVRIFDGNRLCCVARDITARKEAQLRLAMSERRLRTITDNLPVLISYLGKDLRYRFGNATFEDWLGVAPSELLGKTMAEALGENAYLERREQLGRALAGETVHFELEMHTLAGARHLATVYIPDKREGGAIEGVFALTTDISPLKKIEHQLSLLARSDSLTGLPNRYQFEERLSEVLVRWRRLKQPFSLMYLDIDHFKSINDRYGHAGGDSVLRQFAGRLKSTVRASDLVARLAGDEFVIILENLHGADEIALVTDKLLAAIRAPFSLDGTPLDVTASMGVTFCADAEMQAADLCDKADQALYAAKHAGRNGVMFTR